MTWLCRHGWHRWRRIHTARRSDGLGSTTAKCSREGCNATRHEQNVAVSAA